MKMFLKEQGKSFAAIQENGKSITYGDLEKISQEIKNVIPKRSLVFCLCENTIGSLVAYLSVMENKSVPLLLDSGLDAKLLETLITTYQPGFLWVPQKKSALILDGYPSYQPVFQRWGYVLIKTAHEKPELHKDLALLLSTSGSTGSPKLVRQSDENIRSNAKAIADYLEITEKERPITTLPMHYTYGLSIIHSHLIKGATLLLTTKGILQKEFWTFFKKENATSFAGVPYTYEMLKRLRFFTMDLPSLKTMTQAGGKLSSKLHQEFAQYAKDQEKRFYVMYGQTEATARMAYLPYQEALRKEGCMGIAIPGGTFSLLDAKQKEIEAAGITGELQYEGPNVSLGYAESREDLKKGDENQGRLLTGDMAMRDEEGYYSIVGRKKRFIKLFGNRVNLDESERMIKAMFADLDCACTGEDDHLRIHITDENKKEAVKKYMSEKTGIHFSAFTVVSIAEIPKNDAGKTQYQQLQGSLK